MEKAYLITENSDLSQDFSEYDRLYIWDASCEHNLLSFLKNTKFIRLIFSLKKNITIVTSSISNKNIDLVQDLILKIYKINNLCNLSKLEIVINDFWLFYWLSKLDLDVDFIWGNYMILQQKDPYFVNMTHLGHDTLTIDSQIYSKYFSTNKVKYVEIYNVFQWVKNTYDFDLTLYYPYVVYSITRYCPTALIYKNMKQLTIVEDCDWCRGKTSVLNMDLTLDWKTVSNYYLWNKQFYKNDKMITNDRVRRVVYNYDILKK